MKAYLVAEITPKSAQESEDYLEYIRRVRPLVESHGGRYLVQGGNPKPFAGEWNPARLIVVEFPSKAALMGCFMSEEYRDVAPLRVRSTTGRSVIVDGADVQDALAKCESGTGGLPAWMWNEMQQIGTDYTDVNEVEQYEKRMGEFRDLAQENTKIIQTLSLPEGGRILEIGTGTGHFSRAAAAAGYDVIGCDISPMMLKYAEAKAKQDGLNRASFIQTGFLGLPKDCGKFDAVVSGAALHHLPDVWKSVALGKIASVLVERGLFLLRDVVFDFNAGDYEEYFTGFVKSFPDATQLPAARHVAKEFSTLDWIMEGLLERAGFEVTEKEMDSSSFYQYLCKKVQT